MKFYKVVFWVSLSIFVSSCSSGEEENGAVEPSITITSFVPSKDEVSISWDLVRDKNVIIEDLLIYRETFFDDSERRFFELIESLPSSSKSYTDKDVPYLSKISYYVKINYRFDDDDQFEILSSQTEEKIFTRDFPVFESVPYQVLQDPENSDIYHILTSWNPPELKQFDGKSNSILRTKTLDAESLYGTRLIFSGNSIVAGDQNGKFFFIERDSYQINDFFDADLQDNLETFGIIGNRLYYMEDFIFDYINLDTGEVKKHQMGHGFQHFLVLSQTQILNLYTGPHSSSASVYEFQDDLDPDHGWDFSLQEIYRTTPEQNLDGDDIDEFIFTWTNDKTQFLTGIEGHFYNMDDLSSGNVLAGITGKRYLNFIIDSNKDIYASVQEEKVIHVFDGETLELKESIPTKLYPIFPMITGNGLACIGAYERVEYWGYNYGIQYGFNSKTALETF